MKGLFVMVDGLDGSGKGVVVDSFRDWAESQGLKTLDLREYWKSHKRHPSRSLAKKYDAIVSAEPTYVGWGKKIREKLISKDSHTYPLKIAEAFSKDREVLYRKVLLPALRAGRYVFQERGVVTSLVYQPLQEGNSFKSVSALPGNRFCLMRSPDLLILTVVRPEIVIDRLGLRDKKDNAIFETLEFQKQVKKVYESKWLREFFEKKGTIVAKLNTNPPFTEEDTKRKAVKLLARLLKSRV